MVAKREHISGKEGSNAGNWYIQGIKKNKLTIGVILIAFIIILITCVYIITVKDGDVVATVNGEKITVAEFMLNMIDDGIRGRTFAYFNQKYNAQDSKNFWDTSFNGETPSIVAKRDTLESLVKIKIEQVLMRDKGIMEDVSYDGFLKSLDNENKRRAGLIKSGRRREIFGPEQYTKITYYKSTFEDNQENLRMMLWNEKFKVDEDALKKYYQANSDILNYKLKSVKFEKLFIDIRGVNDNNGQDLHNEAQAVMDNIRARILKGEKMEEIRKSVTLKTPLKLQYGVIASENLRKDKFDVDIELAQTANKLNVGQVSEVTMLKGVYYIIRCLEKKGRDNSEYNMVKESVKHKYLREEYEKYINKMVTEAEVVTNHKVYDSLKLN